MANRLRISSAGKARAFIDSLDNPSRQSLYEALGYIQDAPFEHGNIITRKMMPPVVVYTYDDGRWRILYSLSRPSALVDYDISVYSISRA